MDKETFFHELCLLRDWLDDHAYASKQEAIQAEDNDDDDERVYAQGKHWAFEMACNRAKKLLRRLEND